MTAERGALETAENRSADRYGGMPPYATWLEGRLQPPGHLGIDAVRALLHGA
jgi:hypothetical protein